jgi:hypothetical protein
VSADLRVAWLLAATVRLTRPIDAENGANVSELHVTRDVMTPAERRDLADALLRAAWSAGLEEPGIPLLDLVLEADDLMLTEAR